MIDIGRSLGGAEESGPDEFFDSGVFRGMRKVDITGSKFPVKFLEEVVRRGREDPGLRAVLTRHLGDQQKRAWRLAEREARGQVAVDAEAERERVRQEERERIREEERALARSELGLVRSVSSPGPGDGVEGDGVEGDGVEGDGVEGDEVPGSVGEDGSLGGSAGSGPLGRSSSASQDSDSRPRSRPYYRR